MNGTMLSQITYVMFLAHHCLPKVAKICQKKKVKSQDSRRLPKLAIEIGNLQEKPSKIGI